MNRLTVDAVLQFAKANQGEYRTLKRGQPFQVVMEDGELIFRPESGQRFEPELAEYVAEFNRRPSFRPGDYSDNLWSRSYFVALVAAMLGKAANTSPDASVEEPEVPSAKLEKKVRTLRKRGTAVVPIGQSKPERVGTKAVEFKRDPAVKAWVLEFADGTCELCRKPAPFLDENADPFLELHHVQPLAEEGPDTIANAVALCPNCHRACHHSHRRIKLRAQLYRHCSRLLPSTSELN